VDDPCANAGSDESNILGWSHSLDAVDYYQLLETTYPASLEDYREAFHRFALRFHPDTRSRGSPEIQAALTRIFERGAEAYRVLCDATLHARYRQAHAHGALRLTDLSFLPRVNPATTLSHLHLACRSAGAKLMAQQAAQAFGRGDVDGVRQALCRALDFDGGTNADITGCLLLLSTAG
jgi:hypothetical protein